MTDRPSLEDLDTAPEPARWCCAGNAEDCPLCDTRTLPYPWICPGHPDTPVNRARAAGGDQTLDGLRQHAGDVAQRTGYAVTVAPFHDQYAVTVTRPDGGGSHGGYNAAEVRAMLLGIRLAADRGPTARPAVSEAAAALGRVRDLAAQLEECAENALKQDDRKLYAALARDLRTRAETRTAEAAEPDSCCVCGGGPVVYRNFRDQPFCWPCADCQCAQNPCVRTGSNGPVVSPAVAALARVEQLAARIEAGHPVQDNATSLAAAIRDAARTDREQP